MIKIEIENIDIINTHFKGVKEWIQKSITFYLSFFGVKIGKENYKKIKEFELHGKTLNSFVKILAKKNENVDNKIITNILKTSDYKIISSFYQNNASKIYDLLKEIEQKIEKIIISKPQELLNINDKIKKKYPFAYETKSGKKVVMKEEMKILISQIFNYNKFTDKKGFKNKENNWEAYDLAKKLNINTCPYCNRQYTFTVIKKENNEKVIRPTFDHFFAQSKFPFLTLSFYNLIPSCTICNSTLKGDEEFNLTEYINPYIGEFGNDATFSYIYVNSKTSKSIIDLSKNIKIIIIPSKSALNTAKIKKHLDLFEIKQVYELHADIVSEILIKKQVFNDKYLEIQRDMFKNLGLTQKEQYQIIYGNYFNNKDFNKRPLSKLTKDIVTELKINTRL